MNPLLIRLLQAALNNLALPPGIQPALVLIKMPTSGWPAMPFIHVNLELIQQSETAIGEGVENPTSANIWTLFNNARRSIRVIVTSPTAEERDFYRDTLLVVFRLLCASVFSAVGLNASHGFQAVSYPIAQPRDGQVPGFYGADLMLTLDGVFPTSVRTNYPVIIGISSVPTYTNPNFTIDPA